MIKRQSIVLTPRLSIYSSRIIFKKKKSSDPLNALLTFKGGYINLGYVTFYFLVCVTSGTLIYTGLINESYTVTLVTPIFKKTFLFLFQILYTHTAFNLFRGPSQCRKRAELSNKHPKNKPEPQ